MQGPDGMSEAFSKEELRIYRASEIFVVMPLVALDLKTGRSDII